MKPKPNAGRKKKLSFCFGQNMGAHKISASWVSLKWAKSNRKKEEERKWVLTMAGYTGKYLIILIYY